MLTIKNLIKTFAVLLATAVSGIDSNNDSVTEINMTFPLIQE
jgi:hypothetical protein